MKRHLKIAAIALFLASSGQAQTLRITAAPGDLPKRRLSSQFDGAWKKVLKKPLRLRFLRSNMGGALGLAAAAGVSALLSGCDDDDKDKCGDTRWFYNNTSLETLELRFANRSVWLVQGLSTHQCVDGARTVDVYEKYSGEWAATIDLWSNGGGPVYLVDPLEAKLRVDNRTNEAIEVLVNGRLFDRINPGVFWDFPIRAGERHIMIRKVNVPWWIYCDCHETVQPGELIERIITD